MCDGPLVFDTIKIKERTRLSLSNSGCLIDSEEICGRSSIIVPKKL